MWVPMEVYVAFHDFIGEREHDILLEIENFELLKPVQEWMNKTIEEKNKIGPRTCPVNRGTGCYERECAWWNHIDEECAIATLATLATYEIGKFKGG